MKTVRNKTHRPLKVHLPRGRVLHLGPGKEGQVSVHDADAPSLHKLVEAGDLEILGEGKAGPSKESDKGHVHADTHGHHPNVTAKKRGDR